MNDYTRACIFIILGLLGAAGHWVKKRYIDKTTDTSLLEYIKTDSGYTLRTLGAIVVTEANLSVLGTEFPGLSETLGAITAGYTMDSSLNKVTEEV